LKVEALPGRDQHRYARREVQDLSQQARCFNQVLEVIQYKSQVLVLQVLD
jgi:hypothetical protein